MHLVRLLWKWIGEETARCELGPTLANWASLEDGSLDVVMRILGSSTPARPYSSSMSSSSCVTGSARDRGLRVNLLHAKKQIGKG